MTGIEAALTHEDAVITSYRTCALFKMLTIASCHAVCLAPPTAALCPVGTMVRRQS